MKPQSFLQSPHDVNGGSDGVTSILCDPSPVFRARNSHSEAVAGNLPVHGTDNPHERDVFFDESGWQHRLDTGDHALIPPDSDTGLYILLGFILVGSAALFAASIYVLLGL